MMRAYGTGVGPRALLRRVGPLVAPLALAAALAGAAVVTVHQAGCDDPGTYVSTPTGVELVGGCLVPGDVPGAPHLGPARGPDASDPRG